MKRLTRKNIGGNIETVLTVDDFEFATIQAPANPDTILELVNNSGPSPVVLGHYWWNGSAWTLLTWPATLASPSQSFVALGMETDNTGTPSGIIIDINKNPVPAITGSWIPRTGLLATLLTLAGNAGELASATDAYAIVKYNGVAGQAKAFYINKVKALCGVTVGCSAATTALTATSFATANDDSSNLLNSAAKTIASPTPGVAVALEIIGSVDWTPNTTGTYRELYLEGDSTGAGAWANLACWQNRPDAAATSGLVDIYSMIQIKLYGNTSHAYRLKFRQDSTATLSPSANLEFKFS